MIDSSSNPGSHLFAGSHSQERKIAETRRHRSFTKLPLTREFPRLIAKIHIPSPYTPQGPGIGLCAVAIRKRPNFGVTSKFPVFMGFCHRREMDDQFENIFEAQNRPRMSSHFEWTEGLRIAIALQLLFVAFFSAFGQSAQPGHLPTKKQVAPMSPGEEKNLAFVLD